MTIMVDGQDDYSDMWLTFRSARDQKEEMANNKICSLGAAMALLFVSVCITQFRRWLVTP